MSNFLRKGKRSTNKWKQTIKSVKLKDIIPDSGFSQRTKNEQKMKNMKVFKGKSPIECLEINGYEVLKDLDGNVIVGVDESSNLFEGINQQRDEMEIFPLEQLHSIPMENITDYNSLWEITKSGWDSIGELVFPYIFIINHKTKKNEIWRWDNSHFLRVNCLTHNWDDKNLEKFRKSDEFKKILNNKN
jgi:hypothetical protein